MLINGILVGEKQRKKQFGEIVISVFCRVITLWNIGEWKNIEKQSREIVISVFPREITYLGYLLLYYSVWINIFHSFDVTQNNRFTIWICTLACRIKNLICYHSLYDSVWLIQYVIHCFSILFSLTHRTIQYDSFFMNQYNRLAI